MDKSTLFSRFPLIKTNEITLRKIERTDLDGLFAIYNNENLFKYRPGMVKKIKLQLKI